MSDAALALLQTAAVDQPANDNSAAETKPADGVVYFAIGGEQVAVPPLTLYELEKAGDNIRRLTAGRNWVEYAADICEVLAIRLEHMQPPARWTATAIKKRCSYPEMKKLAQSMDVLLTLTGFENVVKNDEAAGGQNSGTGTSIALSPNSQPAASTEATTSESSAT